VTETGFEIEAAWNASHVKMLTWPQIAALIQANPGLSAAMAGLFLSACYIVLMFYTKLGGIKPGVQAFVLSGVLHVVLVVFWGSMGATERKYPRHEAEEEVSTELEATIPASQIVIEQSTRPEQNSGGSDPLFHQISKTPGEAFVRQRVAHAETAKETADLETPDRIPELIEPSKSSLPELTEDSELVPEKPELVQVADPTKPNAADSRFEIAEETAESRAEANAPAGGSSRAVIARNGEETTEVQREIRKGESLDAKLPVPTAAPPLIERNLVSERPTTRRSTQIQITPRQTKSAPIGIDIEDPGIADGQPDGDLPLPSPQGSKFARTGPSDGGRSGVRGGESGLPERKRVMEFPRNTGATGTRIASAAPTPSGMTGSSIERPVLSRPTFDTIPHRQGPLKSDTYKLRDPRERQRVALRHGATKESELAVELSLQWFARHQNPEGFWDADGFDAQCPGGDRCTGRAGRGNATETVLVNSPLDRQALETAGQQADTGLTALVLLTYLGAGYTQHDGQYADQIDRALRWLIRQQAENGYLGGKASHYEKMYCHGMATYALGEACGMLDDPEHDDPSLRRALANAVKYIAAMQNPRDGGWRYLDGHISKQQSDMSMFGWQLMALKSAEIAGIPIPDRTRDGLKKFLTSISLGKHGGLAPYRLDEKPRASMTAEALFCRQVLGVKRDSPSSKEAIEFLSKFPPKPETQDLYYWYYGTLAIYQYGGEPWDEWNDRLRDTIVATQRKAGHAAGSWDPLDNNSRHGGRLYSTALSTMCLEVYYRFLPLYQEHDKKRQERAISNSGE
jgi:hypothetical protein